MTSNPDTAASAVGAPTNEIDITLKMIQAGVEELLFYNPDDTSDEERAEIVAAIFLAMQKQSAVQ
jgi:hypothetical protein